MALNWRPLSAKIDPWQNWFYCFSSLDTNLLLFVNATTIYDARATPRSKKVLDVLRNFNFSTKHLNSGRNVGSWCWIPKMCLIFSFFLCDCKILDSNIFYDEFICNSNFHLPECFNCFNPLRRCFPFASTIIKLGHSSTDPVSSS